MFERKRALEEFPLAYPKEIPPRRIIRLDIVFVFVFVFVFGEGLAHHGGYWFCASRPPVQRNSP